MNLKAGKAIKYLAMIIAVLAFFSAWNSPGYAFTTITILPGKVNSFNIKVPDSVVAGSKFDIRLIALDDYGNVITDFGKEYEGLNVGINVGGGTGGANEQLSIPASEFKNGIAELSLSYKESGSITVSSSFQGIENASSPIQVGVGPFHNLKIVAPDKVVAGMPFGVTVYAVDQYGNPVDSMPMPDGNLKVYLTGDNFEVRPKLVSANNIKGGTGQFSFISDRAGTGQLNFALDYDGRSHVFISNNIDIAPSYFNKFLISTNIAKVHAGQPFIIKIVGIDKYGNVISNINKLEGKVKLVLISQGGVERSSVFGFNSFNKGIALVKTVFNKVGTFSIYAKPVGLNMNNITKNSQTAEPKVPSKSLLLYK